MSIESNCQSTRAATALFDLAKEEGDEVVRKLLVMCENSGVKKKRNYSTGTKIKAMNDLQAKRFEEEKIPWGEYKGAYVGQVKPDYLVWLSESNEFTDQLKRYVKSKRFKERTE